MKIISMGEKEIFFLMKWEKILDLIEVSLFIFILSPLASGVFIIPLDVMHSQLLEGFKCESKLKTMEK